MKKKVRTLEFYGFDPNSTMLRGDNYFPVSDVKEVDNAKYVFPFDESEDASATTEDNG